jgi:hypothetical protein
VQRSLQPQPVYPARTGLDRVITARRFRAHYGKPAYVALYHVENTGAYATPAGMAVNTTPWILRLRKFQRNRTYFMFQTPLYGEAYSDAPDTPHASP